MRVVTLESAIEAAEIAVSGKPTGYIYTNEQGQIAFPADGEIESNIPCDYAHRVKDANGFLEGEFIPGCIVGDILHQHGMPLATMKVWGSFVGIYGNRFEHDAGAMEFMSEAQRLQDAGTPWREAVDKAKAHVKNLGL